MKSLFLKSCRHGLMVIAAIVLRFADVSKRKSAMEQNDGPVYAGRTLGMSETKILKSLYRLAYLGIASEQT